MRLELITPTTGRVVKEVVLKGTVKLSDVVDAVLNELGVKMRYSDLEPYYLVVINGKQLEEGVRWDIIYLDDDDYVVIIPFASGGCRYYSNFIT